MTALFLGLLCHVRARDWWHLQHYVRLCARNGFGNVRYHTSRCSEKRDSKRELNAGVKRALRYFYPRRNERARALQHHHRLVGLVWVIFDVRDQGYTVAIFLPTLRTVLVFRTIWKASSGEGILRAHRRSVSLCAPAKIYLASICVKTYEQDVFYLRGRAKAHTYKLVRILTRL